MKERRNPKRSHGSDDDIRAIVAKLIQDVHGKEQEAPPATEKRRQPIPARGGPNSCPVCGADIVRQGHKRMCKNCGWSIPGH